MEFIKQCINYLKANPTLAYVLIAALAAIVILLVCIVVRSIKRSKAKKRTAEQAKMQKTQKTQAPITQTEIKISSAPQSTQLNAEEEKAAKEAARRATLERLEREEKEEEARLAAEKAAKEAEEKAVQAAMEKAEQQAQAKKTAQKKTERKPAKTAEVKAEVKTETEQDEIAKAVAERSEKEHAQKLKRDKVAAEKAKAKKQAAVQKALGDDEDETEKVAKYSGKWTICRVITDTADHSEEEMYFFELHASNGEKLLSSEEYTSYNGALRGIETHKANIEKGNFKITLSKKGDYIFKLLSGKNMLLCMGENYPTRARCENAIESTKRFAKTAVLDENVQDHLVKVPAEDDTEALPIADNANGKWLITSHKGADGDDVFYFELFANNGEKLLSSEEYTTYIGAVNGIQTHKTNIEKGNFRISLTKRGDYIYKLLNGNGQLLCLGEHYKTKSRCQSAVESVQRFAINSPVLTDPALTK